MSVLKYYIMILELDTALFDIGDISINQLVFLTLCLNENQRINQDIHEFLSRISESEIQSLIDQGLITSITDDNNKTYCPTQKLLKIFSLNIRIYTYIRQ